MKILFVSKKRFNSKYILVIKSTNSIVILEHLVPELLKFDFKFGHAVLETGDMQILVNFAALTRKKLMN